MSFRLTRTLIMIGILLVCGLDASAHAEGYRLERRSASVGEGAIGKITAISAASITVQKRDGTDATFTLSSATTVTIDGQASTISHVTTGEFAAVTSADGAAATAIDVRTMPPGGGPPVREGAAGMITAISATAITVQGHQGDTKTFTISSSTTVTLNGQTSAVSDLAAGEFAAVTSTDGTAATAIAARSGRPGGPPHVGGGAIGKITALSPTSITVEKRDMSTATFTISSSTTVTFNGQTSTVSSLAVGEFAAVTSANGTAATSIDVRTMPPGRGPTVGEGDVGMITAVSATSITVKKQDGTDATFAISSSTTVTLNGQASAVSDLAAGEFAAVTSADGTAATAIAARAGRPGGPPSVGEGAVGKITAVSATSITVERRDSTSATFTITSATEVSVDGDASSASDLTAGEFAAVTSTDGTTATAIAVRTMPPGGPSTGTRSVRRFR